MNKKSNGLFVVWLILGIVLFVLSRGAEVAFFMKQDSGPKPGMRGRIPDDLWIQEFPVVKN